MKGKLQKIFIDGLLVLIPLSVVFYILFRILKAFHQFANYLDQFIHFKSVLGRVAADVVAILLLIVICLFLGLSSKSPKVKQFISFIEDRLLSRIPGYTFVKAYTKDFDEQGQKHKELDPVLVQFDDNSQLGFLIEESKEGLSTVYLPGSPNPYSGSVVYVEAERIKDVKISSRQAFQHLQKGGKGSDFVNEIRS
jgi:uncharacterized membrane protein